MWNWDFFNIFILKPGLTKTFYFMKDFEFSLDDDADFMLKNFKKNFMIWVVPVTEVLSHLIGQLQSSAIQKYRFPDWSPQMK